MPEIRQSIPPTYDSRETGPRYHVTTRIDDRTVAFRRPLGDPFARHTVRLGWRDLLRGLLRRGLTVTVLIGGDAGIVNDVLELDANTLVPNSTRREEFNAQINTALALGGKRVIPAPAVSGEGR
jgi:hypothetical protein